MGEGSEGWSGEVRGTSVAVGSGSGSGASTVLRKLSTGPGFSRPKTFNFTREEGVVVVHVFH